jgi:hypothetical protein
VPLRYVHRNIYVISQKLEENKDVYFTSLFDIERNKVVELCNINGRILQRYVCKIHLIYNLENRKRTKIIL